MEELERYFRVNSISPLRLTQALLGNLRASQQKLVVAISSGLASLQKNRGGGWYGYRAAKAALNMFIRTLAQELGREGFTCVTIDPGWVKTEMGGPGAPLAPEESVATMLKVIGHLSIKDNGQFLNRHGRQVAW